jgi:Zn-dependent oligopeptidase
MPGIGIRNLVSKGTDYTVNFIEQFIKSSANIKTSIRDYQLDTNIDDIEDQTIRRNMMFALIRDTYVCNLLLGYSGMTCLIADDNTVNIYEQIDARLLKYVEEFYNDVEFRKALYRIYTRYRETMDKLDVESVQNTQEEYEIIRFLERIIDRLQIEGKKASINSCISFYENKVYNLLNVTPLIPLDIRHLTFDGGDRVEITGRRTKKNGEEIVEIPLHYDNYTLLINNIKTVEIKHAIELRYRSRTESTLKDFADLIVYRKLFAAEMGYPSYFKYITRDKKDTSEAIKKLIVSLNAKIEDQSRAELLNIYDYFNRRHANTRQMRKITNGDIEKYIRINSSKQTFDKYIVMFYLFKIIKQYFNISINRYDSEEKVENFDLKSFEMSTNSGMVLGRFYLDIDRSENKRINDPISIKVSDRMMISENMYTTPEVVLLANLDDRITYRDVISIFKEFGYVLQELCYRSGVGLVNRDPEFSNFMPLLMENIAWDRSTVEMITQDPDVANHIISMRYFDICTRIKRKCIYAKFDHLLHNSDDVINLLVQVAQNPTNLNQVDELKESVKNTVIQLYQTIHREAFSSVSDIIEMSDDMALASIDPLAIVLEINGSQGLLYSNLMNEIFAYTCYHILKSGLKTPDEFRHNVLEDGITPFKDLISDFISVQGLNSFNLFLTGMLGLPDERQSQALQDGLSITPHTDQADMIETDNAYDYVNTDYDSNFNFFDDKLGITEETEQDRGSIIRINRA